MDDDSRAVVAPSIASLVGLDNKVPDQAKRDGFQSASVIVESVEVEEDARTVVYQPDDGDTAIIWIDSSSIADDGSSEASAR